MPWRQRAQRPQPAWTSTVTRSPTAYSSTAGPSLTTVPIYSWPIVKFLLNGNPPSTIAGRPCAMISRSVAQIATASIRTSTSAAPGCGTGFSVPDFSWITEHPGLHALGDRILVAQPGGFGHCDGLQLRPVGQCSARRAREKVSVTLRAAGAVL